MRFALVLSLAALLGVASGCSSQKRTDGPDDSPPRIKLPVDPDNPPEVVGWWSNGREIACIDQSGLYVILPYPDPGVLPVQYGRWTRDSYAFIWLEPYNTRTYKRSRASLDQTTGTLTLAFPSIDPMTRTEDIGSVQWPDPG
jgi:hypothetical protein